MTFVIAEFCEVLNFATPSSKSLDLTKAKLSLFARPLPRIYYMI